MKAAVQSLALFAVLAAGGCDNMKHQENLRAFDPSTQFPDGASARLPPAHTVARSDSSPNDRASSGRVDGKWLEEVPIGLTRERLARGRDRYDIFCADCHGSDGYGLGIVVRRGFPRPASFHEPRLRNEPAGELFDVIGRGRGVMYGFGDRISAADRWAIVAFIRALQKSQHASALELTAEEREKLPPR